MHGSDVGGATLREMSEAYRKDYPELRYSAFSLLNLSAYLAVCAIYFILIKVYWWDNKEKEGR